MPYAQCPNCKSTYHILVLDIRQWIQKHHSASGINNLSQELCPGCWFDVVEGDRVYLLDRSILTDSQIAHDKIGIVKAIIKAENEELLYDIEELTETTRPRWKAQLIRAEFWRLPRKHQADRGDV